MNFQKFSRNLQEIFKEFQEIFEEGVTELDKNGQGRGDRKIVTPRSSTSWA